MFGRRRRELEQQLEQARREQAALGERGARAEAELTAAKAQLEATAAEKESAAAELSARLAELDAAREASAGKLAALASERDELRTALAQAAARAEDESDDSSWPLLLADLERRWPQPPGARSQIPDDVGEQLSRALAGELERLREEVGVDAEVTIAKTVTPAQPAVFLLAALDLIGALIHICERVVVTLDDDELRLTGRAWEGHREVIDEARTRALAAGAVVTPIEIHDDEVRLTLLPAAS
jgi:multidrug efflux pump subunit AcrA (membrane-fusion protein)